jgi:hypothetical protein
MRAGSPRLRRALLPTHVIHRSALPTFVGDFRQSRAALDYEWHTHYTPARQHVQDEIIREFLASGCSSDAPWLCLTAGAMAAGKTRVVRWLHSEGLFPLHKFCIVEADRIKSRLPEMSHFIQRDRSLAGSLCHRESGYIAELVEREAFLRSKHVLVDGSLRDADWYERGITRLRRDYPHYRVAILLVIASPDCIYARAERRAAVTGREVPRAVLDDAILRVPASFVRLAPLADFSAVIQNDQDHEPPVPAPPATSWNPLRACFANVGCVDESPEHEAELMRRMVHVLDVLPSHTDGTSCSGGDGTYWT